MSVPPTPYYGQSDIYRPGADANEQSAADERLVSETSLQDSRQPETEKDLPEDSKRTLPSSLQPSSSSFKPSVLGRGTGGVQIREKPEALEWRNNLKAQLEDTSKIRKESKAHAWAWQTNLKAEIENIYKKATIDLTKEKSHASRVLPPSLRPPMSVPPTPYGGPSDIYRPGPVVDNQSIGDERLILQTALQDLNQNNAAELDLPEGLLSVSLLRHQKIALAWMVNKEKLSVACSGGILADDQGLGKTISTLALIMYQKHFSKPNSDDPQNSKAEALNLDDDDDDDNDGKATINVDEDKEDGDDDDVKLVTKASSSSKQFSNRKPAAGSLVVCPASVLRQWARELDEKVSEDAKLDVLVYHGGNRTKDPAELACYDVVLTTYTIVAKEVPTKVFDEEDEDDPRNGDIDGLSSVFANKKKKGKKGIDGTIDYSGALAKVSWLRVILDEAETIRNSRTQVSKSCCGLRTKKRWCLSGTLIQNSIDELYSYFRFLKCDPYANYKKFCDHIKFPISRNSEVGYRKLQVVLKSIMLRRTKEMEDTISRAGIDWKKERNHGSRVLPPMSVPTTSYGGPSDPYRPGAVVDELIGDERLIYHKEIDQSSRKRQRCSESPQTPKRSPGSSTSTGSSKKSSPQHFTKSPPHYNNFQGELIQSLLEDINKDCAIAKALQVQIDELVTSIDLKNKLVDKLQKSFS